VKDFEPVMTVATAPYLLVAHPSFPAKDLRELIAYAKARPGRIDYASAGNGTLNHLLGVMLNQRAGLHLVHIPYRGAAAAATDVVAGQVPITFGSFPGVIPFVRSNQLKVIGVATEKRTKLAPDLPTLAESLPGFHANSWYGLFAPAGTPKEVIARLNAETVKALTAPELVEKFKDNGVDPVSSSPEQFGAFVQAELNRWRDAVKAAGLKPE